MRRKTFENPRKLELLVDSDMLDRLRALAEKTGPEATVSSIVRSIIRDYLARNAVE